MARLAAELARLCGYLALALQIVAARWPMNPTGPPASWSAT